MALNAKLFENPSSYVPGLIATTLLLKKLTLTLTFFCLDILTDATREIMLFQNQLFCDFKTVQESYHKIPLRQTSSDVFPSKGKQSIMCF